MNRFLQYLIPIMCLAATLLCAAGELDSSVAENPAISLNADLEPDCCIESLDFTLDYAIEDGNAAPSVVRVPNQVRHIANTPNYQHRELAGVSNATAIALSRATCKEYLTTTSLRIEPTLRLIYLGRLII